MCEENYSVASTDVHLKSLKEKKDFLNLTPSSYLKIIIMSHYFNYCFNYLILMSPVCTCLYHKVVAMCNSSGFSLFSARFFFFFFLGKSAKM